MNKRKRLPESTKRKLLLEAGYMCGNPRCRHILVLELHHLEHLSVGGGDSDDNSLALCANCHSLHHAGHIPTEALRVWKQMLVMLNSGPVQNADILIQLHKMESNRAFSKLLFSGDSMLILAPLLNAGMVEFEGGSWDNLGQSALKFKLTVRGRAVVDAWLNGNSSELIVSAEAHS